MCVSVPCDGYCICRLRASHSDSRDVWISASPERSTDLFTTRCELCQVSAGRVYEFASICCEVMANLEGCTIQWCSHVVVLVFLDGRSGHSLDEADEKYS